MLNGRKQGRNCERNVRLLVRIFAAQFQGIAWAGHQAWGWDQAKAGLGCSRASGGQDWAW